MKKLLTILVATTYMFTPFIYAGDSKYDKGQLDKERAAEEALESKGARSKVRKSPLEKLLDLRRKNKNGEKATSSRSKAGQHTNNNSASSADSCSYNSCIHYDYPNFKIGKFGGTKYSIRDGNEIVASHHKLSVMEEVDDFIRYYSIRSVCYVGNRNRSRNGSKASMSIWYKTDSNARQVLPAGSMRGEDCLPFDINNIQVKKIQGDWKIVDGKHWMLSFGRNAKAETEANNALCLIKKYKLSNLCWAGSRQTLQYLRK